MVTHLSDWDLSLLPRSDLPVNTESEKAFHLMSILLSIRRPATIPELASRCTLFSASPDLVEHLCEIRNSPIFLTSDLFVTPSPWFMMAFVQLVTKSNLLSVIRTRVSSEISCPEQLWKVFMPSRKRRQIVPVDEFAPVAKRRIFFESEDVSERVRGVWPSQQTIQSDSMEVLFRVAHNIIGGTREQLHNISGIEFNSGNFNKLMVMPSLQGSSSSQQLTCKFKNVELSEGCASKNLAECKEVQEHVHILECQHNYHDTKSFPNIASQITEGVLKYDTDQRPNLPTIVSDKPVALEEANDNWTSLQSRTGFSNFCCLEEVEENNASSMMVRNVISGCEFTNDRIVEGQRITAVRGVEMLNNAGCSTGEYENSFPQSSINLFDEPPKNDHEMMNKSNFMMQSMEKEQKIRCGERHFTISAAELSVVQKPSKSHAKMKPVVASRMQASYKSIEHSKAGGTSREQHDYKRNPMAVSMKQKLKQNRDDAHIKERRVNNTSVSPKDQMEPKELPKFESFIVEEEEGSGGYGTVYRARRKSDGITVAIKCPHAKAHKHHVTNELKMLERFGGKNYVIKYEGCFKSSDSESDCLVLQHVEHDRPEVLKKDIDVSKLQWYGYCMFKALASLHKQGIVHKDVKPGNFLFSRKTNKGYLIDFNLATDLHQKYGASTKTKAKYDVNSGHSPHPSAKSMSAWKFPAARSAVVDKEAVRSSKSTFDNLKKKVVGQKKPYDAFGGWDITKSQGADGSGITSTKDVTSTRTPSAERMREPMPSQGRKELINLLQEAMRTPSHGASHVPAPLRKRVAASPGPLDKTLYNLTPMPLHSTGRAVAGAGFKNKGDGKLKREGPCVGTKGFRAPEVLFRSLHQGPKVDVWSAGVTLLYLMTGRTPFFGDPEQNIKEIAKLRGSEDLWEVAKLHNREASFPVELYDIKFLPSLQVRDWCEANTKRPDLFKVMPTSLFDLVDKCLTVNPRTRISADEALNHEFFAPCHLGLKKQRLIRQGLSLDSGTSSWSLGHSTSHGPPTLKVADEHAYHDLGC